MARSYAFEAVLALIIVTLSCLIFLMITYTPPRPEAAGWELPGNGTVDYMFIGSNDTLYAFRGNDIAAVRSDGSLAWTYTVPGDWSVLNNWSQPERTISARPVVAESAGHLYVLAVQHLTQEDRDKISNTFLSLHFSYNRLAVIMALSPDGKEEWEYPFTFSMPSGMISNLIYDDTIMPYTIALSVRNGNIYLFKDFTEQIIDQHLEDIKIVGDVAGPAAIDEDGHIYVVRATRVGGAANPPELPPDAEVTQGIYRYYDGMMPTGIVEAYSPDRTLLWSRDIGHGAVRQELWDNAWDRYNSLPLYANGMLYVPIGNGVVALDRDGQVLWERELPENDTYSLFEMMPVDEQGNVYVTSHGIMSGSQDDIFAVHYDFPPQLMQKYLYVISPQGTVSQREWTYGYSESILVPQISMAPVAADNGLLFAVNSTGAMDADTFDWLWRNDRLNPDRLYALDAKSGARLWEFTVPAPDKSFVRLTADNLKDALPGYTQERVDSIKTLESHRGWRPGLPSFFVGSDGQISVYPGGNVTYLNYYFATFESPIIYGQSRCIYARSLYAIDSQGKMLWSKPVAGLITAMAANNTTFFYGTSDGRIGSVTGNVLVAGIALMAMLYLFFRFLVLGTITRARTRLDKNKNRNTVLQFIVDHPGVTAVDVSRALKMNLGTVRYHLFILTANHKIITHKEDGKFLRYFTNAGTYSERERSLLSLMRREPLKRILKTLAERPGLSNLELARELDVSTASVHENVNELFVRGIVARDTQGGDRGYAYTIKEEYRTHVMQMMQRL